MNPTSLSYTLAYAFYTNLNYAPEFGYYLDKAKKDKSKLNISITDIYENMKNDKLFNKQIIANILTSNLKGTSPFDRDEFRTFIRYITL